MLDVALRDGIVDGMEIAPRAVQQPRPPLWVGGSAGPAVRRAARQADGWLPQGTPLEQMPEMVALFRSERGDDTGDIGAISEWLYVGSPTWDLNRPAATGSAEQIAEALRAWAAVGVNHLQVRFASRSASELIDQVTEFGTTVGPLLSVKVSDLERDLLAQRVAGFERRVHDLAGRKAAAVAVAVVTDERGAGILLTKRAEKMRAHAGQWALPGGRLDAGETPEDAALRELSEEVGLTLSADVVLGRLDDYSTRSGYRITPVVMWAGAVTEQLAPNPRRGGERAHRVRVDLRCRAAVPRDPAVRRAGHPAADARHPHPRADRGRGLPVPRARPPRPDHPGRPPRAARLRLALATL